jgi:hypothetical protein
VGTGSREENATKQRKKHFQAKHVPAKTGMGTGSREENATRQRNLGSDLLWSDRENASGRAASREIEDDGRRNLVRRPCLDQEGGRGRQGFAFGRPRAI